MAAKHVWTINRRVKTRVVLMFFGNPTLVSGQEVPEFVFCPLNTRKDAKIQEPSV
jgi:hypothetical protein